MSAKQQEDFARFRASVNGHAREPVGMLASEVVPERVTWLWPGRLALGKISMLDGNPGLGKSTLQLDIASRITTGDPFPGSEDRRAPAGVVVLSAEDGVADTIVPRLRAAGADLGRVLILRGVKGLDGVELGLTIPGDLSIVAGALERVGAALLLIDPLMAYFGPEINANRDQDVRRALAPMADMLEERKAASWLVRHLTKGESKEALYRGGGSIGIIGAARFGTMVARDPDDDEARIVAATKCNIGKEPSSLRYRLVGVEDTDVARVVWDGEPARWTAVELLDAATSDEDRQERTEAEEWLADFLGGDRITAEMCRKEARKAGHSDKAIKRAKSTLKVQSRKEGFGREGYWVWFLPSTSLSGPHPPDTGPLRNIGLLRSPYSSSSSYVDPLRLSGPLDENEVKLSGPKNSKGTKGQGIRDGGPLSDEEIPWRDS